MKKILSTFLLAFTLSILPNNLNAFAQNKVKNVQNNKAPEISVKSINTKEDLKLSNFKGKYIFLDFWATWCDPCIKGIPHLEEIQKTFKDKVKIISISDEKESIIKSFLNDKKINYTIATDINNKTNKLYPHDGIPFIVIIKPDLTILGAYHPDQLSIKDVSKIVTGDDKNFSNKYDEEINSNFDSENIISYSYFSKGNKSGFQDINIETNDTNKPYKINISNMPVIDIYNNLYKSKFSDNTIINEIKNPLYKDESNVYSFAFKLPDNAENFNDFYNKVISRFNIESGIKTEEIIKKAKVKVLKLNNANKLIKNTTESYSSKIEFSKHELKSENTNIETFLRFLSRITKSPIIINETNYKDKFDINLSFRNNDIDSIMQSLEAKGFYFEDAERDVTFLRISD